MPEKYRQMTPKGRKNEPKWLPKSMKIQSHNPCLKKLSKNIKSMLFSNPPNHEKRCFPAGKQLFKRNQRFPKNVEQT